MNCNWEISHQAHPLSWHCSGSSICKNHLYRDSSLGPQYEARNFILVGVTYVLYHNLWCLIETISGENVQLQDTLDMKFGIFQLWNWIQQSIKLLNLLDQSPLAILAVAVWKRKRVWYHIRLSGAFKMSAVRSRKSHLWKNRLSNLHQTPWTSPIHFIYIKRCLLACPWACRSVQDMFWENAMKPQTEATPFFILRNRKVIESAIPVSILHAISDCQPPSLDTIFTNLFFGLARPMLEPKVCWSRSRRSTTELSRHIPCVLF